jgi:preprotein translocase subunit SecD
LKTRPAIEFRLIVDQDTPGGGKPMHVQLTNESLCIGPEVIADSSNVQSVSVSYATKDIPAITIMLDTQGAAKMKTATERRIRQRLALIVDGELFAAPFINSELTDIFYLVLNVSDEELERMAPTLMAFRTLQ